MSFLPALKDTYKILWSLKVGSSKSYAATAKMPKQRPKHQNAPRKKKFLCCTKSQCINHLELISCLTKSVLKTQKKADRRWDRRLYNHKYEQNKHKQKPRTRGHHKIVRIHFKRNTFTYFLIKGGKLLKKLMLWYKKVVMEKSISIEINE